jgi:hypothetical protein
MYVLVSAAYSTPKGTGVINPAPAGGVIDVEKALRNGLVPAHF